MSAFESLRKQYDYNHHCSNCSTLNRLMIPRGESVASFLARTACIYCGVLMRRGELA